MKRKFVLMLPFSIVVSAMVVFIVPRATSSPRTIWVPDEYLTIQEAVNAAVDGDIIRVRAETYAENVLIDSKSISLIGEDASNTTIRGVYKDGWCDGAVEVRSSTAVLIKGFTIVPSQNHIEAGIYIWSDSYNCTIMDNVIANFSETISYDRNWYGIVLDGTGCKIVGNTFLNDGLIVSYPSENVVENNTVNGKPLVYLEDASDLTVDNAGQVILVNCSDIRVENVDLSSATVGVELWETNNTKISGNNITKNVYGVACVYASTNNSIVENDLASSTYGIYVGEDSNDSEISGNNIADNFVGIYLSWRSSNNTIRGNNIANNSYGVYCYESINNKFYHNNFIDNTYYEAYPASYVQIWDDGCEGNYWSNYTGTDSDGDGIGDTPYFIDVNNQDNCPLMSPYMIGDINHDGSVDINDLLLVDDAYGTKPEDSNWNCHCDIAGPEENSDGLIDIYDLATVGKNYGKTAEP